MRPVCEKVCTVLQVHEKGSKFFLLEQSWWESCRGSVAQLQKGPGADTRPPPKVLALPVRLFSSPL